MRKFLGWLIVLAIGGAAYLYVGSASAQAATCASATTNVHKEYASGEVAIYHYTVRTCGHRTRTRTEAGTYTYRSGEKATANSTTTYRYQAGRWVRVSEHSYRSARYATGRVTVTQVWIKGCSQTREVDTSFKGTYSQRITDSRVC